MSGYPRMIIVSTVWGGFGDFIFAVNIKETFREWDPEMIFYALTPEVYSHNSINFLKKISDNSRFYKTSEEMLIENKQKILQCDIIIFSTPEYSKVINAVLKLGYRGKYYRLPDYSRIKGYQYNADKQIGKLCSSRTLYLPMDESHNIYTGFSEDALGIWISPDITQKSMALWDKKYYPYDNVFTCYLHDIRFISCFITFVNENFPKVKNLVVVQGNAFLQKASEYPVISDSVDYGKIYEFSQHVHIIVKTFSLEESCELYYFSHNITAASGNNTISTCISYGKTAFFDWRPDLSKTYCVLWNYLKQHGYQNIVPIYRYLIDRVTAIENNGVVDRDDAIAPSDIIHRINVEQDKIRELRVFFQTKYNLQKNLYAFILKQLDINEKIGGHTSSRDCYYRVYAVIAIIIIITLFYTYFELKKQVVVKNINIRKTSKTESTAIEG